MRSTKRGRGRSIIQHGQTLHHFFQKATPQQQNPGTRTNASTSQEVIVIDSDDDNELESPNPVKRRRLSSDACSNRGLDESLPDIIFLNTGTEGQPSSIPLVKKLSDSGENAHSKNTTLTTAENRPAFSFGSPVLLLSSTCSKPYSKKPVQSDSFEQLSALLQGNPATQRDTCHSEHPSIQDLNHSSEERSSVGQTNDVDIDLTLGDWENHDNEPTEDDWAIPGNTDNVSCVGALKLRRRSF